MKKLHLLTSVIIAVVLVSGCTSQTSSGQQSAQQGINIEILEAPTTAKVGEDVKIVYEVTGGALNHLGLHYNYNSIEGLKTQYSLESYMDGEDIYGHFEQNLAAEKAGTMYIIVHGVSGWDLYWSEQIEVKVE